MASDLLMQSSAPDNLLMPSSSKLSTMTNDLQALLETTGSSSADVPEAEALTALILSATQDAGAPIVPLSRIYTALCHAPSSIKDDLDTLTLVPCLLPCLQPAADEILAVIGECASAKETVIAVQEALEHLSVLLETEELDEEQPGQRSKADQLILLVKLCSSAVPRLRLRKKSPSETIQPLVQQLQSNIALLATSLDKDQGHDVLDAVASLALNTYRWAKMVGSEDAVGCSVILDGLLDTTLSNCSHCIQSSLAQRTFMSLYPRLVFRSTMSSDWERGEEAVMNVKTAFSSWGHDFGSPTLTSLIILAHSDMPPAEAHSILTRQQPVLLSCLTTNEALDECLALLMKTLPNIASLDLETIAPLSGLLSVLASNHPDDQTRHHAFRILSLVLKHSPVELRMQILQDLTTDADFPQLRVAAIGLVKEAVLDALATANKPNLFASPKLLQAFGPVLFRPDPIDLFSSADVTLDDLRESHEPARITECLSLYYVLLVRDTGNRTGIRDRDQISNIEKTLLTPIRRTLSRWMSADDTHSHIAAILPIVSLKTSLERVDSALQNVG
ncbi:unnamed protein product [Mycena citricolor]|uniref:Uncharacterized protein n=1 Tax=Mycena citricolor TaxID=2018698 RepID=A0AAD2Q4R7_9AGAR|nr:unnamed protein product [Mycena citricolor]